MSKEQLDSIERKQFYLELFCFIFKKMEKFSLRLN
jgi:hypothetical protein